MLTTSPLVHCSSVFKPTPELLAQLDQYILERDIPADIYDCHRFLTPLTLIDDSCLRSALDNVLAELHGLFKWPSQTKYREALEQMLEFVVLNLALGALTNKWTLIDKNKSHYSKSYSPYTTEFSYSALMKVIDTLKQAELIRLFKGGKYVKGSMLTRIYPVKALEQQLYPFGLAVRQSLRPPYLTINEPETGWDIVPKVDDSHPDKQKMYAINEAFDAHLWACKGPVVLKYKHNVFTGGRVYTPFQTLLANTVPLRMHTLIDGEPIAEVDFNASHIRMGLALFGGEDAGDDPYRRIADYAQTTRDKVKGYITHAMSCTSAKSAAEALKNKGYGGTEIETLENATRHCYPSLRLYDALGIHLQSLEGEILMYVMYQGVLDGKVVLPIHDAVAVKAQDTEWAAQRMEAAWVHVCCKKGDAAKPRLKVSINSVYK
jgi:hypothetical protein